MKPKAPRTPPGTFATEPADILDYTDNLVRIHTTSPTPYPWNSLRPGKPLHGMRWDHHPADGSGNCAITYAAANLTTALAEVFQDSHAINLTYGNRYATIWNPVRPLRLLDLSGTWLIRQGAAHSLSSAPRSTCRAWARGIHAAHPDLDGLYVPSTMTGDSNIVLWETSVDSFPADPLFSRPLASIEARTLRAAADTIRYRLIQ